MFRSDKPTEAAERLARALDAPHQDITTDDEVNAQLAAARALAPSTYPREAWRAALKARMLREHAAPLIPSQGSGSRDPRHSETHRAEVLNPDLGRVVLADIEAIDESRAESVARALAHLAAEQAAERTQR